MASNLAHNSPLTAVPDGAADQGAWKRELLKLGRTSFCGKCGREYYFRESRSQHLRHQPGRRSGIRISPRRLPTRACARRVAVRGDKHSRRIAERLNAGE